jgi:hypothetical protein
MKRPAAALVAEDDERIFAVMAARMLTDGDTVAFRASDEE